MNTRLQDHFYNVEKILNGFGVECYVAYGEINVSIKDQRDTHLVLRKLKKSITSSNLLISRLLIT